MNCTENQQKPILICGMHRSGTSLIAQMLFACGLYLGEESTLMKAHTEENPTGYWEYNEIVNFSEELITKLNGSWSNPNPFKNPSWLLDINLKKEQRLAIEILHPLINSGRIWGWKDPRLTIILPFWKTLFPQLKLIICVRNPMEVAYSLSKRLNGHVDYDHGLKLWQDYHEILLRDSAGLETIVVHYKTMLLEPKKELNRICKFINLSPAKRNLDSAINRIKTNLYRSVASEELLSNCDTIPKTLFEIYQSFTEKAGDNFIDSKGHPVNSDFRFNHILEKALITSTTTFDRNFRIIKSLKYEIHKMNRTIKKLNIEVYEHKQTINRLQVIHGELNEVILSRELRKNLRFKRPSNNLEFHLKDNDIFKNIYHYIMIKKSRMFDKRYYLLNYPDVVKADMDPLWHYVQIGWKESRNPSSIFNSDYYLEKNNDVKQSGINPLIHYIRHGKKEGRRTMPLS